MRFSGPDFPYLLSCGAIPLLRFKGCLALAFRNRGIGGLLLCASDEYDAENGWTERPVVLVPGPENAAPRLPVRRGFALYCAQRFMVRCGGPLSERAVAIRLYTDVDNAAYAKIMADVFWNLLEQLRPLPNSLRRPTRTSAARLLAARATCSCWKTAA